jgi:hypothetical protein
MFQRKSEVIGIALPRRLAGSRGAEGTSSLRSVG